MAKTIIHATLELNFTKKSDSAITGNQLGAELFAEWNKACTKCHSAFYNYIREKRKAAGKGKDGKIPEAISDAAFEALQSILDLVGEVNGHAIVKNNAMLDTLANEAVSKKEPLAGRALTIYSQLKNAKDRLDDLDYNGVNPDTVTAVEEEIEALEEEFKEAKKETGACAPTPIRVKYTTFRKNFEKAFYSLVVEEQELKSWEELEAEDKARKDERKAKAKAYRQAKREAAKAAKAAAATTETTAA